MQTSQPAQQAKGMVHYASRFGVAETLDRLTALLESKGVRIFARIDHAAAAAEVGLDMRPTEVLVFGNPKLGTLVMQAVPTLAIDLPFKALAWEDDQGRTWLSCNTAGYLAARHHADAETVQPLAGIEAVIKKAVHPD